MLECAHPPAALAVSCLTYRDSASKTLTNAELKLELKDAKTVWHAVMV